MKIYYITLGLAVASAAHADTAWMVESQDDWLEAAADQSHLEIKDGKVDQWTEWQTVQERYEAVPGFAKQVARIPARMDLSSLPEGDGFQFELRLTDSTENPSKPILDAVSVVFE